MCRLQTYLNINDLINNFTNLQLKSARDFDILVIMKPLSIHIDSTSPD